MNAQHNSGRPARRSAYAVMAVVAAAGGVLGWFALLDVNGAAPESRLLPAINDLDDMANGAMRDVADMVTAPPAQSPPNPWDDGSVSCVNSATHCRDPNPNQPGPSSWRISYT